MPDVLDNIDKIPAATRPLVPGFIFQHEHVGYFETKVGIYLYRYPTLKECLLFDKAAQFHMFNAVTIFLKRILLTTPVPVADLDPETAATMCLSIIKESYPGTEEIYNKINQKSNQVQSDLAQSLETFVKAMGDFSDYWDMTVHEVIDKVGLSQVMTGQKVIDEKENKRQRRQRPDARRAGQGPARESS